MAFDDDFESIHLVDPPAESFFESEEDKHAFADIIYQEFVRSNNPTNDPQW